MCLTNINEIEAQVIQSLIENGIIKNEGNHNKENITIKNLMLLYSKTHQDIGRIKKNIDEKDQLTDQYEKQKYCLKKSINELHLFKSEINKPLLESSDASNDDKSVREKVLHLLETIAKLENNVLEEKQKSAQMLENSESLNEKLFKLNHEKKKRTEELDSSNQMIQYLTVELKRLKSSKNTNVKNREKIHQPVTSHDGENIKQEANSVIVKLENLLQSKTSHTNSLVHCKENINPSKEYTLKHNEFDTQMKELSEKMKILQSKYERLKTKHKLKTQKLKEKIAMEQRCKFEEMERLSSQVEISRTSLNAELSWKSEAMRMITRAEQDRRNAVLKINDLNETLDQSQKNEFEYKVRINELEEENERLKENLAQQTEENKYLQNKLQNLTSLTQPSDHETSSDMDLIPSTIRPTCPQLPLHSNNEEDHLKAVESSQKFCSFLRIAPEVTSL